MPWMTVPIALAIGSLAATGVGVGEQLANQPSAPKMPTAPTGPAPLTPAQNTAQQQAATQSFANQQAQTGGDYTQGPLALLASTNPQGAGNVQAAWNQWTGLTSPGSTGFTPGSAGTGGLNILDLLAQSARPGGGSPFGAAGTETGAGDVFKGLVS